VSSAFRIAPRLRDTIRMSVRGIAHSRCFNAVVSTLDIPNPRGSVCRDGRARPVTAAYSAFDPTHEERVMSSARSWTACVIVVVFGVCGSACRGDTPPADGRTPGQPANQGSTAATASQYTNGLSAEKRSRFYHLPEGGELYPVDWLLALETTGADATGNTGSRPFLDTLGDFGFIPDAVSADNPYGLPVGMTVARSVVTGLDTVGVNCAACHVGELTYAGATVRIDGGPNLISVPAFVKALVKETTDTARNPVRLIRFLKRSRAARERQLANRESQAAQPEPAERDVRAAAAAIAARIAMLKALPALKAADTGTPEGYGRTDAFGNARNELFSRDAVPPTAPVSLPHLWGMERTAWLQWGANTNSVLQRNIGQIIGTGAWTRGNMSSVKLENLNVMEELAYEIQPPRWPAVFPEVNKDRAAKGRELYGDMCASCHEQWVTTPTGLRQYQLFSLEQAGTDPNTALNFEKPIRTATGATQGFPDAAFAIIDGVKEDYYRRHKLSQETIARLERRDLRPPPPPPMFRAPLRDSEQFPDTKGRKVYPAKTLAGIWATAPFLHNGSVPSLYDLLLPVAQRPTRFAVGQREYDPVRVGYQQDPQKYKLPPNFTPTYLDTTLPGNSNAGHDWKLDQLTDEQRWAIVEYLKTF
jgi:mono/diheme cytochrome c family protein